MNPRDLRGRVIPNDDVEKRALQIANEENAAVPVSNVEARRGWWSNSNNLGVRLPFQPPTNLGTLTGSPMSVLMLPEAGLPRVWTVSLGLDIQGELGAGEAFEAIATIDFGAGGVTQTVECDWLMGTTISFPMNALNVKATWIREDSVLPEGLFLSAMVARGALARSIATRSFFETVDGLDEGGDPGLSAIQPIPAFARSVELIPRNAADIPLVYSATTLFTCSPNTSAGTGAGAISGDFLGPGIRFPIPMFAKYWQLSNGTVDTLNVTVKFNLFDV